MKLPAFVNQGSASFAIAYAADPLLTITDQSISPQYRYYNVRVYGHNNEGTCTQLFNNAGLYVVRNCGGYNWPNCYQRIRTAQNVGINTVRAIFNNAAPQGIGVDVDAGPAC